MAELKTKINNASVDTFLNKVKVQDEYNDLIKKPSRHSNGKSCLYIKALEDVDKKVSTELITRSVKTMKS